MRPAMLLAVALSVLSALGCRTVVYLEEETPPGQVPPASGAVSSAIELPRGLTVPSDAASDSGSVIASTRRETLERFTKAYVRKGRPRIAVFLNRELSDEIREWDTPARIVSTGNVKVSQGTIKAETNGEEGKVLATATQIEGEQGTVYGQTHVDQLARPGMREDWAWQFEESVLQELLKARIVLVDRAIIMRAVAEGSGKQGDAHNLQAVKAVEMEALRKHADLLLELLVRRNAGARVGYEFRGSVKEIRTGRILANVTSLAWRQEDLELAQGKKFRATSEGYVRVEPGDLKAMGQVASLLARDILVSLSGAWDAE